jgi:PleD family two-component response regulator
MSFAGPQRRRVLVAAAGQPQTDLLALFAREPLADWETHTADSFSAARFVLQHTPCDVLLVHEDLYHREGYPGLAWLAFQRETPILFLGSTAEQFARAYELGVALCLPRDMAFAHAPLLHESMKQTMHHGTLRHLNERTHDQLIETRRHVDRLVSMIWRITPRQMGNDWLSQRHLMERLEEELSRSQRHRLPLSIAVGELQGADSPGTFPEGTAELLVRGKRRCDIVGQYGPRGFMLLMVHTSKPRGVMCCRRLQQYIEQPVQKSPSEQIAVRAYFGLASTSAEMMTPQTLLRAAEQNLDSARRGAQMCVVA